MDLWARGAFAELSRRPLFQSTRDLSRAVLEPIKRMQETPGKFNDGRAKWLTAFLAPVLRGIFDALFQQEVTMQKRWDIQIHEDTEGPAGTCSSRAGSSHKPKVSGDALLCP